MKKFFILNSVVIFMTFIPYSVYAQSFLKQLGKVITDIANSPSSGNQQNSSRPRVYNLQQPTAQSQNVQQRGPLYQIHTTSNTKTITIQGGATYLGNFSCGVAMVQWKKGWFAINQSGEKVFDFKKFE